MYRKGSEPDGKAGRLILRLLTVGKQGCPPQHGLSREMAARFAQIGVKHAVEVLRQLCLAGLAVRLHTGGGFGRWCLPEHASACAQYIASINPRMAITPEAPKKPEKPLAERVYDAVAAGMDGRTVPDICALCHIDERSARKHLQKLREDGRIRHRVFGSKFKGLWFTEQNRPATEARAQRLLDEWFANHSYRAENKAARKAMADKARLQAAQEKKNVDEEIARPFVRKWTRVDKTYKHRGKLPANSVWQFGQV